MKTDALIAMLARGPVEADLRTTARRLFAATAAGLLIVVCATWFFLDQTWPWSSTFPCSG